MKNCPDCLSDLNDGATVCRACGTRVVGRPCPECAELARSAAKKCPHCGHSFAREEKIARVEAFTARADLLPTMLFRFRLIPQEIHLSADKIVITTWGFFWLSRTDEEIPWDKIAGYHYYASLFWDSVEIQTRGQHANTITHLPKALGARVKEILERMKE